MDAQAMDARFDRLEQAIFVGFDQINKELQAQRAELQSQRAEVQGLRDYVMQFRAEVIHRFQTLENRVEMMSLTLQAFDIRVPGLIKAVENMELRLAKLERPAA
jgi:hypothetical protein